MLQVLNREGATSKSDVYSFGIVLWECLTRKLPWQNIASVGKLLYAVTGGERPTIPPDSPADLAALADACWANDPAARPSLERVLADLDAQRVTSVFTPPVGRSAPRPPIARPGHKVRKLPESTDERLAISDNSWSPRSFATARNTFGVAGGKRGRLLHRRSSSGGSGSRSVPVNEEESRKEKKEKKEGRGEDGIPRVKSREVEGKRGDGGKDDVIEDEQEKERRGDVPRRFKRDAKRNLWDIGQETFSAKSYEEDRRMHRWIMQPRQEELLLDLKTKKTNSTHPWTDEEDNKDGRKNRGRVKKTLELNEFAMNGNVTDEGGGRVPLGHVSSGEQGVEDLRHFFRDRIGGSIGGHLSSDERGLDVPTNLARRPRTRVKSPRVHAET